MGLTQSRHVCKKVLRALMYAEQRRCLLHLNVGLSKRKEKKDKKNVGSHTSVLHPNDQIKWGRGAKWASAHRIYGATVKCKVETNNFCCTHYDTCKNKKKLVENISWSSTEHLVHQFEIHGEYGIYCNREALALVSSTHKTGCNIKGKHLVSFTPYVDINMGLFLANHCGYKFLPRGGNHDNKVPQSGGHFKYKPHASGMDLYHR